MGAFGIFLCGLAGRKKEEDLEKMASKEISQVDSKTSTGKNFSLSKGLPLCLLAGVLSALYGFSLDQGQPIADIAADHGAGSLQGNVIYIFSNTGAFITTLFYCLYLHRKEKTFGQYRSVGGRGLILNYAMAALTGLLWYGQFFFYGLGHVRVGSYTSWAIHMVMLVLLSSLAGLLMKEWSRCSKATKTLLAIALLVLVGAVLLLAYGNILASSGDETVL
jgi:L-rhamnose-H+ transport protein